MTIVVLFLLNYAGKHVVHVYKTNLLFLVRDEFLLTFFLNFLWLSDT